MYVRRFLAVRDQVMTQSVDDVTIDLSATQKAAEDVRTMLLKLREDYDLSLYEYARQVKIAPGEIPHSQLTLNTRIREDAALLSTYLHEQMHWYVTWYSHTRHDGWKAVWAALLARYPRVPVAFPEGAHTVQSSYLHLIVNWLEIEASASLDCNRHDGRCAESIEQLATVLRPQRIHTTFR